MLVSIANDLLIRGEEMQQGYFVAVQSSQPVRMFGADVVRVVGVVQEADDDAVQLQCRIQLLGSNEPARWHPVDQGDQDLPPASSVPTTFQTPAVEVSYHYVKARWVLYPISPMEYGPLTQVGYYLVTAGLNTSVDPSVG